MRVYTSKNISYAQSVHSRKSTHCATYIHVVATVNPKPGNLGMRKNCRKNIYVKCQCAERAQQGPSLETKLGYTHYAR